MPDTIEIALTEDGPLRIRGNGGVWERGETRELEADRAEQLLERDGFVRAEDVEDGDEESGAGDTGAITIDDVAPEEETGDFDADEWLDEDYRDREQAVLDGEVDAHLDEIEDIETSGSVEKAVEERRNELED